MNKGDIDRERKKELKENLLPHGCVKSLPPSPTPTHHPGAKRRTTLTLHLLLYTVEEAHTHTHKAHPKINVNLPERVAPVVTPSPSSPLSHSSLFAAAVTTASRLPELEQIQFLTRSQNSLSLPQLLFSSSSTRKISAANRLSLRVTLYLILCYPPKKKFLVVIKMFFFFLKIYLLLTKK